MPTRGITRSVRRHADESDPMFLWRATEAAKGRGVYAMVETEMGVLCQACAPFATTDRRVVKIVFERTCYNCGH